MHSYLQWEIICSALASLLVLLTGGKSWKISTNSGHILYENHSPGLFQNSCTGNTSEEENAIGEILDRVNGDGGSTPRKKCGG